MRLVVERKKEKKIKGLFEAFNKLKAVLTSLHKVSIYGKYCQNLSINECARVI